ncbi:MAG: ATP-binding protein [Plesiomonas sp.]|uniref:ORC-CDC6 family AAA ATPase n=1 Tax=Plesiomonas sp. TaxID=2486279 RepID=UPI003F3B0DF6
MTKFKSDAIRECVSNLANSLRAENIEYDSYIDLYSGIENIDNINNRNNTIIYGRRGSGKTHLLKALSERLVKNLDEERNFPVYIDARRIIPLLSFEHTSKEANAILIFKYIIQELANTLFININPIFGFNPFDDKFRHIYESKVNELSEIFKKLYLEFNGKRFSKPSSLTVSEEEVRSLGGNLTVSKSPSAGIKADIQQKKAESKEHDTYISILDVTNEIEAIIDMMNLNRITVMIDEWSEIERDTQLYLADILKKSFSAIAVTLKIAAIPNRTNLGIKQEQKFFGLEDGGDIFGYNLDARYIFETNKQMTRNFFNDLLYKHLSSFSQQSVNALIKTNKASKDSFINIFFANVALNEIFVASAGIPRDFINLFISSYDKFICSSTTNAKRISVRDVRAANMTWYDSDKREQVDKHPIERTLLAKIIKEIVEMKKSIHFLVPERYSNNKHIQNLIDFRVMHLIKKGISHKDHPGVIYNAYSIDYGCYNYLNISKNKLSSVAFDFKELREVRRISLEDSFFEHFMMEIGEAFICPHCSMPIDVNHLAYKKQKLCNHCYESVKNNEVAVA